MSLTFPYTLCISISSVFFSCNNLTGIKSINLVLRVNVHKQADSVACSEHSALRNLQVRVCFEAVHPWRRNLVILKQNSPWIQFWQLKYYTWALWNESFQVLAELKRVYSMVISLFIQTFSDYRITGRSKLYDNQKKHSENIVKSLQDHKRIKEKRACLKGVLMLIIHIYY